MERGTETVILIQLNNMFLAGVLAAVGVALFATASSASPFARAADVSVKEVYHAKERPGYACWTALWHDPEGTLYLAFSEKRRAPNPLWEPVPIEFWESMDLPVNYHISFCNGSKDIVTELVVLKSADDGETWTESGRCPTKNINAFAWNCLADGRIIKALSDNYTAFDPKYQPRMCVSVSADGGTTWRTQADVILKEGNSVGGYRIKRLTDNSLAMLGGYGAAFGPGRPSARRGGGGGHHAMFVSHDEGKTWSMVIVLPGVKAPEPDFVELPSGDLLIVNSTVQHGPQVRQYLYKTARGFLPGSVLEVISGRAPECLVLTRNGLLVGAVRGGEYTCSNDQGATWYRIDGLPSCRYQPHIIELSDGRLLCSWHVGGDFYFGQSDQWVGSTTFRLEADLPKPTKLTLTRHMNADNTKYINAYVAKLTAGGRPVSGKTIHFSISMRYAEVYKQFPMQITAVTDEHGQAELDLESHFVNEANIHQRCHVTASFTPGKDDRSLTRARDSYGAYVLSMSRDDLSR